MPDSYDPNTHNLPTVKTVAHFEVGALKFWALGDRVIVQEDEFRTGYECTTCDGKCHIPCADCSGKGEYQRDPSAPVLRCTACEGKGTVRCPSCDGKGALIVAPQTAERRPTSGAIVSAGQQCKFLKEGDCVLYSNFAGYVVDLDRAGIKVTLRILHESEILAQMDGHLTLTNLKGKTELPNFSA